MATSDFKRKFQRFNEDFGKLGEPIAIFTLIVLFIVPILTVINLTADVIPSEQYSTTDQADKDVLGVKSDAVAYGAKPMPGSHSIVTDETLRELDESTYLYYSLLSARKAGNYSKPVATIYNSGEKDAVAKFVINEFASDSYLNLIIDDVKYTFYTPKDGSEIVELPLKAKSSSIVYLEIFSRDDVNYQDPLSFEIYFLEK